MIAALAIGSFLKRFWLPLTISGSLLVVGVGAYIKGRSDMAIKQERAVRIEVQKRYKSASKFKRKADEKERELYKDSILNPDDDERDSCILSNNPFRAKCI
jgi:hypothetical protein